MSNYIYDLVKIKYIREGYLPDLPYHLVSDNEMYDAFLSYNSETDTYDGYFTHIYTEPTDEILLGYYRQLRNAIYKHLCLAKSLSVHSMEEFGSGVVIDISSNYLVSSGMIRALNPDKPISKHNYVFIGLPNWIYSYMLGNTISDLSDDEMDYEDLLNTFKVKNITDMEYACYKVSIGWLTKLPNDQISYGDLIIRPPTLFGEPHILKAIRLEEAARGV